MRSIVWAVLLATFFLAAILYWWRITDAAPHIHKRMSRTAQVAYTLAAIPPNSRNQTIG